MLLPMGMPLLSHGTAHALHDHHASHHQSHAHNDHDNIEHISNVVFYSDHLHVDLQTASKTVLKTPSNNGEKDKTLFILTDALPADDLKAHNHQTRAPPDNMAYRFDDLPVYLSTQRLRI